jgi:aromatic-L-amino-acid decarboxylase
MTGPAAPPPESSLDPADWGEFRRLAHEIVDDLVDWYAGVGQRKVWQPMPDEAKRRLETPLPQHGSPGAQLWGELRENVLPWPTGNTHPRFLAYVHGSGTPGGALAELIAGAINANLGGREHAPVYVERQVIEWCRQLFAFPEGASGLVVSGTSMATLLGLAVARERHPGERLVAYASAAAHGSVSKAVRLLGLGRQGLRTVPVDDQFRIRVDRLEAMIEEDRAQGLTPFCIVGNAGSVDTGAIDDLAALADLAAARQLWLHVDGAFGALAILVPELAPRLRGIDRAHSLAFDFHKWLHVPYGAGCLLVRDGAAHRAAFSSEERYLVRAQRGLAGGAPWFCDYGVELSRGFLALKVWWTLREQGLDRLGRKIAENCAQARYLADRVRQLPGFEVTAPVSLNIACFRAAPDGVPPEQADKLNEAIVVALQERGIAAPSTTTIAGRRSIRVCICNHRTTSADVDEMLDAIVELSRSELPG